MTQTTVENILNSNNLPFQSYPEELKIKIVSKDLNKHQIEALALIQKMPIVEDLFIKRKQTGLITIIIFK